MGAGTNVQERLIALHHLDVPWRPSDIEQQEGRILRQGNINPRVKIFRYVTESTFDSYSWQIIENKQKFIGQIMTSKLPVRSCDEFLTDRQLGKSKDKINDINAVMNVLEKKVSSVEKTFKELQQSSTDLQSMFVDNLPPQGALTVDKTPAANTANNSRVPDMSVSQMKKAGNFKRKRLTRKQKKDIVSYIDLLTSEGYSAAQVGYVLKCAEDGMSPVEIEEFIHPDLSVQMMEQIRVMKNKQKS